MRTSCKCGCGQDSNPKWFDETVKWLEDVFGDGIYITSGNRCKLYNESIGGAKNSRHIKGIAFDIAHVKISAKFIYMALIMRFPYSKGIGYYPYNSFVHIDGRLFKKRWYRDIEKRYKNLPDRKFINKYIVDREV